MSSRNGELPKPCRLVPLCYFLGKKASNFRSFGWSEGPLEKVQIVSDKVIHFGDHCGEMLRRLNFSSSSAATLTILASAVRVHSLS